MLVCNVSQRAGRRSIAADLAEAAAADDASTTGQIVFATLVDDPASVNEIVDAYLGQIMLEAANAADATDASLPAVYTVAIVEAASAIDTLDFAPTLIPTSWNPSDKVAITLSNSNLTATPTTSTAAVRGITSYSSGKYYFECQLNALNGSGTEVGVATASATLAGNGLAGQAVATNAKTSSGSIWINGSNSGSAIGILSSGNIIGVAVDLTALLIWFRIAPSGSWNGSGTANPATGTGGVSISALSGSLFPFFGATFSTDNAIANFGASAFSGTVPAGFASGW